MHSFVPPASSVVTNLSFRVRCRAWLTRSPSISRELVGLGSYDLCLSPGSIRYQVDLGESVNFCRSQLLRWWCDSMNKHRGHAEAGANQGRHVCCVMHTSQLFGRAGCK